MVLLDTNFIYVFLFSLSYIAITFSKTLQNIVKLSVYYLCYDGTLALLTSFFGEEVLLTFKLMILPTFSKNLVYGKNVSVSL